MKLLLSLCDRSGVWSQPYLEAGWEVVLVDLAHGQDVLTYESPRQPDAVLAAPPCTCFCRPSARWWHRQDADGSTAMCLAVLRACHRICKTAREWWALENPPGRFLREELGDPAWQYQPFWYGDAWGKQTLIWGTAKQPEPTKIVTPVATRRTPNGKTQGRIAFMSSSWKTVREQTPAGFAKAFYDVNH